MNKMILFFVIGTFLIPEKMFAPWPSFENLKNKVKTAAAKVMEGDSESSEDKPKASKKKAKPSAEKKSEGWGVLDTMKKMAKSAITGGEESEGDGEESDDEEDSDGEGSPDEEDSEDGEESESKGGITGMFKKAKKKEKKEAKAEGEMRAQKATVQEVGSNVGISKKKTGEAFEKAREIGADVGIVEPTVSERVKKATGKTGKKGSKKGSSSSNKLLGGAAKKIKEVVSGNGNSDEKEE